MKNKKFSQKLTLGKETVTNLNVSDLKNVQGGVKTYEYCNPYTGATCETNISCTLPDFCELSRACHYTETNAVTCRPFVCPEGG